MTSCVSGSLFVQVTVVPTGTVRTCGVKVNPCIHTSFGPRTGTWSGGVVTGGVVTGGVVTGGVVTGGVVTAGVVTGGVVTAGVVTGGVTGGVVTAGVVTGGVVTAGAATGALAQAATKIIPAISVTAAIYFLSMVNSLSISLSPQIVASRPCNSYKITEVIYYKFVTVHCRKEVQNCLIPGIAPRVS